MIKSFEELMDNVSHTFKCIDDASKIDKEDDKYVFFGDEFRVQLKTLSLINYTDIDEEIKEKIKRSLRNQISRIKRNHKKYSPVNAYGALFCKTEEYLLRDRFWSDGLLWYIQVNYDGNFHQLRFVLKTAIKKEE